MTLQLTEGQHVAYHMGTEDTLEQQATIVKVYPNGACDVAVAGAVGDEPNVLHGLMPGDSSTSWPHFRVIAE
jgi:hypothetical protein